MATLGANNPTLLDWANGIGPDSKELKIVEILNEFHGLTDSMMVDEGNEATGNVSEVRTGLPSGTWRALYTGVVPSKDTTMPVRDKIGNYEQYSEMDKDVADLGGKTKEYRQKRDIAHIEAMNQEMSTATIYANTASEPEKYLGLAPRYGSLSAASGGNVLDAGGTGSDNLSIWLITWDPATCFAFFPKGQRTGLMYKNHGEVTLGDATNGYYQGYRSHFKWQIGITLADWRYCVRIANVDVSNLTKDASGSSADLIDLCTQAIELLPSMKSNVSFYGNQKAMSFIRRQAKNSNNVQLSLEEVAGKKVATFDGIPFRRVDALLNTESQVS